MPESLPADLKDLRSRLEKFLEGLNDLPMTPGEEIPRDVQSAVRGRSREEGFFNLFQPKEFGGQEVGPLARVVVQETLAAANTPLARFVLGPGPGLLARATGSLRDSYLEPVLSGEKRGAFAFTEPSGADALPRPTWAARDGDELVVTGQKSYVSGGATADFYVALVNVDESPGQVAGPAMLIIDRGSEGVVMERNFSSLDGGDHVAVGFHEARVPVGNILGEVGEGMQRALGGITEERIEIAASSCGLATWAVEHVAEHISQPHPSGTRLGDREGVRLRYSDMQIETYVGRSVLYRTARLAEAGEDIMNEAMATKVYCSELVGRIADAAVQLVGGQALVVGHPLEEFYRRVRGLRLAGGAVDLLRLQVARGRIEFGAGRL